MKTQPFINIELVVLYLLVLIEHHQIAKLTASTDGVGVKQTEAEIDWSGIDTVPVLLDPVLTSNGTHPNSISDALREVVLNGSTRPGILF
ncbi:unnamed protein product [Rotaria magnacalcarata]|uniref:Uncharacterized protein n=1 Tax=Rotaria magnacalcarata TaxID=392030 RepID=A0A820GMX6_9BILA|nr:unnamed protein product [Rotaria magnacalcarata]